jgi:GAF domain-containing protein
MNDKVTPKENGRQYRSEQLQLIAEIGQATSAYRDVDKLLYDMVYLIRDQLGFYYVSIFFPVADRTHLTLIEATGEIGQELKQTKFHIPFAVDSIIGWVAVNQQARIAHNVGDDPLYLQIAALSETRSEIALPLLAQGELLGVLDVQSRDAEKFDGEDLAILQILANHVAVNIDNAQLFALREARLNETEALLNLNNLLTTTLDVGEIYRRAARVFTQQLRVARCAVSSWELEANTVTTQAEFVYDLENDIVDQYEMSMPSYDLSLHVGTAELLKSLIPVLRQADDPQLEQSERQILLDMDQHYCLELPLVRGDAAVGIVELYRTKNQRPFSNEDVQLAQAMANQTAIAIDNATLASKHGRVWPN